MGSRKRKKRHYYRGAERRAPAGCTSSEIIRDLEAAIQKRRVRKAVGLAKLLRKSPGIEPVSAEITEIIVKAYELRLLQLLESGLKKEADSVFVALSQSHPEYRDYFSTDLLIRKDLETNSAHILPLYETVPEKARLIDDYIKTRLTQISDLAGYTHLPGERGLRKEAELILLAWEEVESTDQNRDVYKGMLKTVGRHSPLVNWRLFIQGLNAFYDGKDMEAKEIFERISRDSPIIDLAAALVEMIEGKEPCSHVGRQVAVKISKPSLYDELEEIDDLIAGKKYKKAEKRISDLLFQPIWKQKSGLQREIAGSILSKYLDLEILIPERFDSLPDRHFPLLQAEFAMGLDSCEQWDRVLYLYDDDLTPLEKALINNRLAELALKTNPFDELSFANIFNFFRSQAGIEQEKEERLMEASEYLQESADLYPLRETFSLWYEKTFEIRGARHAEKILESWHAAFPEDAEPLVKLVNSYRERKVYRKAIKAFRTLDGIAAGNPEVEAIRIYLYSDDAISYMCKGKPAKAEEQLAFITAGRDVFCSALAATLMWVNGQMKGGNFNPAKHESELLALEQPLSVYHVLQRLREIRLDGLPSIPQDIKQQWQDPDVYVNNLHILAQVSDPVWEIHETYFTLPDYCHNCFYRAKADSSILRRLMELFIKRDDDFDFPEIPDILWQLSANGIKRNDSNLFFFLAYRGALIDSFMSEEVPLPKYIAQLLTDRGDECFGTAYWLAEKRGSLNDAAWVESLAEETVLENDVKELAALATEEKKQRLVEIEGAAYGKKSLKDEVTRMRRRSAKKRKRATRRAIDREQQELYEQLELI